MHARGYNKVSDFVEISGEDEISGLHCSSEGILEMWLSS